MIVNGYKPGEGITSHVDLLKFDDGIAVLSLGSPATMTFTKLVAAPASDTTTDQSDDMPNMERNIMTDTMSPPVRVNTYCNTSHCLQHDVFLEPGDLLLLHGEARYAWKHGIAAQQSCSLSHATSRVSVTLRKLAVVELDRQVSLCSA